MVVAALIGLHYLPSIRICDYELRQVNIWEGPADVTTPASTASQGSKDATITTDSAEIIADTVAATPSLHHFFSMLDSARLRPVRIAYFGDSFIEGDIMTSALRNLLQQTYGGKGVGWVDIQSSTAGFRTTVIELSRGWQEHNAVGSNSSAFDPELQGISGRYYIPTPGAYIDIRGQKRVYGEQLDTMQRATLYFTPSPGMTLTGSINGTAYQPLYQCDDDSIAPDTIVALTLKGKIGRVRVNVDGEGRFYGMAFESWRGITLDSFPMRGSPGYHIGAIPEHTLQQFAHLRPYDLIILHFGLNMASPTVKTYQPFKERFKKCIELYKRIFPNASFLLVSMNDRDVRGADGQFHTMDGVLDLVEIQRQMAEEEGIMFWNLQQAMGGEGSMARLQAEGKANHDYTHINFRGGEVLGKLLFDFLQTERLNEGKRAENADETEQNGSKPID